jgi:ferric-chelate reductase
VGGTGITGALSLADWWLSQQSTTLDTQQRFKIVWSIRDVKMADLAEIRTLQDRLQRVQHTADIQIHVSSQSGRLQPGLIVDNFVEAQQDSAGSTFVYISGPEGLATGAEEACVRQKRRLRQQNGTKEITWHNATFTV